MRLYRVIKLDKSGKRIRESSTDGSPEPTTIRHKVKVKGLKPGKIMRKLWGFWL